MKDTARPILCYVTDRRTLPVSPGTTAESALLERIRIAAAAGVGWIQLREKDLQGHALMDLARASVAAGGASARIFINDRLDIAWAAGANGVHLGENSLPLRDVAACAKRRMRDRDFLVGASCHSLAAARSAQSDGAHYIIFGPVFATPSKAGFGPPQGTARLAEVCLALSIPVIAIGGITEENASECLQAGAGGVAGIRCFQEAPDLKATAAKMRSLA